MKIKILAAFIFVLLLSSCKVHFTQELRLQLEEQGVSVEDIQFYNSRTIILQRIEREEVIIRDTAKLKETRETLLERIRIRRNRPCVCTKQSDNTLDVRFNPESDATLKFVLYDTVPEVATYKIGATSWENDVGVIPYDSYTYYLQPRNFFFQPRCNEAALKVKKRYLNKWKIRLKKYKGVKIDEK